MSLPPPYGNPLFSPLAPWLAELPPQPSRAALVALLERHPRLTVQGHPLRFVPPTTDGMGYEARIAATGAVETRDDNWHDFFNALVWLAFPAAKQAISAVHAEELAEQSSSQRNGRRDALTHFDECGIAVLSSNPHLLDLLRGFAWEELFVRHREAVRRQMRFILFGHASYEQMLAPFHGLTAKGILFEVPQPLIEADAATQLPEVDRRLAEALRDGDYRRPRDFQPLPLLGIPGVTPASEDPAYYRDTDQFRPGRRSRPAGDPAY